jgi:hypothetical protein
MTASVPVTLPEWREFLRSYSDDYVRVATDEELAWLDEAQRERRWLGYGPATEDAVRAAEERLGTRLPPSYRNFLLASNGWRSIDLLIGELLTVEQIGWLPEADPALWETWAEDADDSGDDDLTGLLQRCVLLSAHADGDYWLLDGNTAGPDGEWTAYLWMASSGTEPQPYPSFGALVAHARERFETFRGEHGRPLHPEHAGDLLSEGRRQALAGEVGAALASLRAAHAKGSALAPYLAGLLTAFTEPGLSVTAYISNNVLYDRVLAAVDEVHLRAELIPLFLNLWRDDASQAPGYLARRFERYLPPAEMSPGLDPALSPGARARAEFDILASRAARYVPPVLPETPAFQRALDEARGLIAAGDDDAAWEVIRQALPLWEPGSPYRIASVILRVEPALRQIITPDRSRAIVTTPRRDGTVPP